MARLAEDSVVVKNIYYMMAYAFGSITLKEYRRLETESFDNVADLLAAILIIGIQVQRKRGFEKDYIAVREDIKGCRGRIDMCRTSRLKASRRQELGCEFDEYSEDTYMNQILKACARLLLASHDVEANRKLELKACIFYLSGATDIDPHMIYWGRLRLHRNNASYRLLMNVCYMIVNSRLLGGAEGESALADYVGDKRLSALYEKFVLEYFRREHPDLQASSKYVQSVVENEPAFLPKLHTDVTLVSGNHELIIDCKCYGTILHAHMDKQILAPTHRNQIYTYVMHESFANQKLNVEGMLLYALTEKESAMHETWTETGHNFHCFTLDLGKNFTSIAAELDAIAEMVRGACSV